MQNTTQDNEKDAAPASVHISLTSFETFVAAWVLLQVDFCGETIEEALTSLSSELGPFTSVKISSVQIEPVIACLKQRMNYNNVCPECQLGILSDLLEDGQSNFNAFALQTARQIGFLRGQLVSGGCSDYYDDDDEHNFEYEVECDSDYDDDDEHNFGYEVQEVPDYDDDEIDPQLN